MNTDFEWGVVTTAHQCEGKGKDGRGDSIWDTLERQKGKIFNDATSERGSGFYDHMEEDINRLEDLGANAFRFSFNWSRLFPSSDGIPNQKAVSFYHKMLDLLQEKGIKANATIYHWDLPQWAEDLGGWADRKIVDLFVSYAKFLFKEFGSKVSHFVTLNEPIAVYVGYAGQSFAPALGNREKALKANYHMLLAHGRAVEEFRKFNFKHTDIGIVIDIWKCVPARPDYEPDVLAAKFREEEAFLPYLMPLFFGQYSPYMQECYAKINFDVKKEDLECMKQPIDFLGINVYSRHFISVDEKLGNNMERAKLQPENFTKVFWEIYPNAISEAVDLIRTRFSKDIPIIVTEIGSCFKDVIADDGKIYDYDRAKFLELYIQNLFEKMKTDKNIHGVYVWGYLDAFEWTGGYEDQFGLIYVNPVDLSRTPKLSYHKYKEIIKNFSEKLS